MISVGEAQQCVLERARPLPPVPVRLDASALGLVLAEDVAADLDVPPFAKAMMDGYAVRTADLPGGVGRLTVTGEITAGRTPDRPVSAGEAVRIMTGAPLPDGADAVVMIEHTRPDGAGVQIAEAALRPGLHVMPRGKEMRRGEIVLQTGARIRPQELGLLATVGRAEVRAHPAPRVAVLSTGDEVVEAPATPGPGQIRNGNGPMLLGQACRAGGVPRYLGIARDRIEELRSRVADGLRDDVLILSGGVSAGDLDLVPQALAEQGVQALFHRVAMKPGKPVLFGIKPREDGDNRPRLVFGLPGNPVSSMVCFELFVRPAIRVLMGLPPGPRLRQAALAGDFHHRSDRPTYYPARLRTSGAGWRAEPVPWFGSPDLRAVTAANAFIVLAAGEHTYRAGDTLNVLCVEELEE